MTMKFRSMSVVVLAAAASQVGATNCGQITKDPGFDLWCGDALCAWTVERGSAVRVATWNEGDPGVGLLGEDSAIAQLTPVTSSDGTCIEFDLIANIDDNAQVKLNVDVGADGTVDLSEVIPSANWKPLSFIIALQAPYAGVRFELAKQGAGNAVLAQINAKIADAGACAGIDPVVASPQANGEPCSGSAGCASGHCGSTALPTPYETGLFGLGGVCIGCGDGVACGSGAVCGVGPDQLPTRGLPQECVAAASEPLGGPCASDAECATGICFQAAAGSLGACSTCDRDHMCGSGEACGAGWAQGTPLLRPFVCSPGGNRRQPGEACAAAEDCASHVCDGAVRSECTDGRTCVTADDCPSVSDDKGLHGGPCTAAGIQGGTCH